MFGIGSPISKKEFWLFSAALFILTIASFINVFKAEFISWDDADLLMNNKAVRQFSLGALFNDHYTGNYMPLTMILHAFNWMFFKNNATGHHGVDLLIHAVNGILVFYIALKLFKNKWGAVLTAIVFCLHPLQTESVAWIAETKTVLFAFFFFLGFNSYMNYLNKGYKKILYVFVLPFFVLALLSKSAAVVFPVCLLAVDLISGRKLTREAIAEKIPFFILSLIFGLGAIYTQQQDRYINESHAYPFLERIGYAGYAVGMYLVKFLLPFKLAVIYPYPQSKVLALIIGYVLIIAIAALIYLLIRKKQNQTIGILLFILANLILVLQIIPFGEVLTADRYMYLPVIGFTWLFVWFLKKQETLLKILSLSAVLLLGTATFVRSKVWKDSLNLYADILKNYPDSPMALNSLGAEFMLRNEDEKAYRYLSRAIELNPNHYKYYYNRGLLLSKNNKFEEALNDLSKSIELKRYPKAYGARANVYYKLKDLSKCRADAEMALSAEPNNIRANYVLGNCYEDLDQLEKALYFYGKTIELNSQESLFYLRRAIVFGKQKKYNECLNDLESATTIDPSYGEAYYWKGVVKINLNQDPCADLQRSISLGFEASRGPAAKYCK